MHYFRKGFVQAIRHVPTTGRCGRREFPSYETLKKYCLFLRFSAIPFLTLTTRICDPPGNEYAQGYRVQFYFLQ